MAPTVVYEGHRVEAQAVPVTDSGEGARAVAGTPVPGGGRAGHAAHLALRWLCRRVAPLVLPAALGACSAFVPLREPPRLAAELPPGDATTRDEVIARFGPPDRIGASDVGEVLVYRRPVVVETNPSRYAGEDRDGRLDRYERILIYLDPSGRIVRTASELE